MISQKNDTSIIFLTLLWLNGWSYGIENEFFILNPITGVESSHPNELSFYVDSWQLQKGMTQVG